MPPENPKEGGEMPFSKQAKKDAQAREALEALIKTDKPEEKKEEKPETAPEKGAGILERAGGAWERLKQTARKHPIWTEALRVTAGAAASVAGIKSFYDVPEYFRERFAVRGFRKKGGLDAATEKLLATRWELKKEKPPEKHGEIKHAIADLNRRLKMTKEGVKKGSEQRQKLAEILRENRIEEKHVREERQAKVKEILDNYTTTKVTGMQAAREALNTTLVATGAFTLRGGIYGLMDAAERYQRLAKEARIAGGGKPSIVKDVLVKGIRETFKEAVGRGEQKTKLEKGLSFLRAWGKIARYTSIGAMALQPERTDEALNKMLDALSGKVKLGQVRENFQENIERYASALKTPYAPFWQEAEKPAVSELEATISQPAPIEPPHEIPGLHEIPGPHEVASLMGAAVVPEAPSFVEHVDYQGGRSVWNEGEKQLGARFEDFKTLGGGNSYAAEALKTYNIDRIKDTIVESPEKYGLSAVDVNKVTTEQLRTVNWDKAFADTFGERGLTKELSQEQTEGILRSNSAMKAALAQGVVAHEAASPISVAGAEGPLPEQLEYPPPNPDAYVREQELVDTRPIEGEPNLTVRDYIVTPREPPMGMRIEEGATEAPSGLKQFKVAALWNENVPVGGVDTGGEPVEILDPHGKTEALPDAERAAALDMEAHQVIANRNANFGEAEKNIISARQIAFGTTFEQEKTTFEQLAKNFGIERDRWASEDPLEFWRKNPTLETRKLENIFYWNRASGNTLNGETVQKYIENGLLPKLEGKLYDTRTVDLVKILEYPQGARESVLKFIGSEWDGKQWSAPWVKSGLFSGVEWEVKDGNATISFDVKNNPVDVDLKILRDGTIAVDGHGMQNWHLDKPVELTENNLKEALEFITRRDGKGAVAIQPVGGGRGQG
ncbi:hypothetical protein HYV22_04100 [Candidatus Gottesmanbacteria bacterium]|nr:hypothetical protein [Candidatus Gottesmanbacteria bacterium]